MSAKNLGIAIRLTVEQLKRRALKILARLPKDAERDRLEERIKRLVF